MLGLPNRTEFNIRITKEKFYSQSNSSQAEKNMFVSDVERIIWKNKLSEQTINIVAGKNVIEIEVIYLQLKTKDYNTKILKLIKNAIPYPIVFALEFENEMSLAVYYNNKFFSTKWNTLNDIILSIEGLNLDVVWENMISQIGGVIVEDGNSLDEQIVIDEKREKLQRKIDALEKKVRKEKQPKIKLELVQEIEKIKKYGEN